MTDQSSSQRSWQPNRDVFLNCPFDDGYKECFAAIVFTVTASGYRVRCALEENDSGRLRLEKLSSLITESDWSIHDLSRVQVPPGGHPRFNMPFELGLTMGAKTYGGSRQKKKKALILVEKKFGIAVYLSDLAGIDPTEHEFDRKAITKAVRDYLHHFPGTEVILPGVQYFLALQDEFEADLPDLAAEVAISIDELHPIFGYRNYMAMLMNFLNVIS